MMVNNQLKGLLIILVFHVFQYQTSAQNDLDSPYTAFGLGYLSNINSIKNISLGSLGISTRENNSINIANPASYTAFDTASFLFEGGVTSSYNQLKTEAISESFTSASISQLTFGFPINGWWKNSLGLLPFSKVGYNVNTEPFQNDFGTIAHSYQGEGGLSRVYWGNAFQPFKFLSIGFNASYLFGKINRIQKVSFPDSVYFVNTRIDNSVSYGDFFFEAGVQYFTKLKKDITFVAGLTYRPQIEINAKKNYLVRSSLGETNDVEFFRDTIVQISSDGEMILPAGYGAGVSLRRPNHWFVGLDYKAEQWEKYKNFGANDSLVNSSSISVGGYLIPDYTSNAYLKRIEYRLGGRYYKSYLELKDIQLSGFGITFGFGLPLRSIALKGSKSMVNIGAEIGRRGTMENGLIQESYTNFYLGVSIYEFWFFKRRYN